MLAMCAVLVRLLLLKAGESLRETLLRPPLREVEPVHMLSSYGVAGGSPHENGMALMWHPCTHQLPAALDPGPATM